MYNILYHAVLLSYLLCSVISVKVCDVECDDVVWMHGVFIVWNQLEDMAQLQPWPCSLVYSYGVKAVCIGLNLCSKTVSWADVPFAYSCTATIFLTALWTLHDTDGIVNSTISFARAWCWNELQYSFFGDVMPLAPASASYNANCIIDGITAFLLSR